ncbi:MAG: thiamine diphosphokinase [Bacteroidetes bacterium]|nr:thiamine diphosphokinase [Bacteroidota bacterium]
MKKCIILANGKPPSKSVIEYLKNKNFNYLICADGGANSAKRLNLIPDIIIGDFDSINESTLNYFKNKSKKLKLKRQNDTDVEKCLKFAIRNKFKEAVLLGVTGDRLDHTFCNLGIVLKFYNLISIKIIAESSYLSAYSGYNELDTIRDETISIYGLSPKTKIISEGLKYPLRNIPLPFGEKESTSNIALSDKVKLKVKGGKIFVIRDFKLLMKNGFI